MKQSLLFTKTRKHAPSDEVSKNAELLIRAGFIHKEMAGVYAYLPLGLRVIEKIKNIVREEMNQINGQEIIMTALQRKSLWEQTDRWSDDKVDIWFKSLLKNGTEVGFGWSHEEPITDMMTGHLESYRDLPAYVYQFQTKLRNEVRAKSGIMRGREFVMKDLYSYSIDDQSHEEFYNLVKQAYMRVFDRVGLGDKTFETFASGGAFTEFSHEFQTLCDAGEDVVYLDRDKGLAVNEEVFEPEVLEKLGLDQANMEKVTTAEVGNIFSFGGAKSEQLGLMFTDKEGNTKPVILGSYGIGITRLMGVVAEIYSDETGLVWPTTIAPYSIHLLALGENAEVRNQAQELYQRLGEIKEVLFDDREISPGQKFKDADLIGIPHQLIVSERSISKGGLEYKNRITGKSEIISAEEAVNLIC